MTLVGVDAITDGFMIQALDPDPDPESDFQPIRIL